MLAKSLVLLVLIVGATAKLQVSCLGKTGKKVDWFIAYKMPRVKESSSAHVREGVGLVYMESRSPRWILLPQSVEDLDQPISYTLNQMYSRVQAKEKLDDLAYVLYNDRTPSDKMSSSKAHAKGTLFVDRKSGFWLSHSVPAFPPAPASATYDYPSSGDKFGQIFLCVSVATKNLDTIATYLQFINPQVYSEHIGTGFNQSNPETWMFIKKNKKVLKRDKVYTSIEELPTLARNEFVLFAKSKHFGKDLYDGLVAPTLGTNLLTETWLNGNGDYESVCKENHSVKNILKLEVLNMSFINSQDHAKWSVSDKEFKYKDIREGAVQGQDGKQGLNSSAIKQVNKLGDDSIDSLPRDNQNDETGIMDNFSPFLLAENLFHGKADQDAVKPVNKRKKSSTEKEDEEVAGFEVKKNSGWVCVGDINRQESQSRRGGGALCLNNIRAWQAFHDIVVSVEGCNSKETFI